MIARIDKVERKIFVEYGDPSVKFFLKTLPGYRLYAGTTTVAYLYTNAKSLKDYGFMVYGQFSEEMLPINYGWKTDDHLTIQPQNGKQWFAHQNNTPRFLFSGGRNGRGILSWEPGAGKTCGVMATLANVKGLMPCLFVVPASIKTQWQEELKKWIGVKTKILYGQKPEKLPLGNYIINWDILTYWQDVLRKMKFQMIVGDEFHKALGDTKSKRSKAFFKVFKSEHKALFLSGTPYNSKPIQLYPILHKLDPKVFNNKNDFRNRYCNWRPWGNGRFKSIVDLPGVKNGEELAHMLSHWMYRVEKRDIVELPDVQHIPVKLDVKLTDYAGMQQDLLTELAIDLPELQHILNVCKDGNLTDVILQRIINSKRVNFNTIKDRIASLERSAFDVKKDASVQWIKDFMENEEKLCIFAYHKAVIEYLHQAFKKDSVCYYGDCTAKQKEKALKGFLGKKQLMIMQMGTSTGVDHLQDVCKYGLFVEFGTATEMDQVFQRLDRFGQKDKVTIYYHLAAGTIDEYQLESYNDAKKVFDKLIRTGREKSTYLEEKL